ncbi:LysR substrate-binding domain-containing protein [Acidisphaera sp. L21]|uniref:LysR substrate-binding domain-containing protein n=1 Tax=Acidisphaera sp. L21 TaxID=1641851 RepID=UPI001C202B9C|nr:LysR substrate-binding domain-containing protein [Acidisphaera sp. L21]
METGRKTASGTLRVSMPLLFGRVCAAPVLMRLATQHATLELQLEFSDRVVNLVEDGFDLAVRNGPLGNAAGLMKRKIMQEQTIICAAPSYIDRCGLPENLDDLRHHNAITYARRGRIQAWLFPQPDTSLLEVIPPTRMRFDDLGAIVDAALSGYGLAWLPSWLIADRLRLGVLRQVLPALPSLVTDIHAVWPRAPTLPFRVRAAIDALAEQTQEYVRTR